MTTPNPRQVEYLPLADLVPDPRNPKSHDEQTINDSIGRFGVLDLIVQDQRTGYIVSGHGRRKALSAMEERGETPPEGIKTDSEGRWLVPVVTGWASRTDAEAGAALIALNRTTELGGWVDDALLDLLDDLSDIEDGLQGVGFTQDDIDALEHLTYEVSEDQPARDLDALYEEVGDPLEEDSLERVVVYLSSHTADRLSEYIGNNRGEHEAKIVALLSHLEQ